ncbi:MAG: hypothetical protein ACLQDQ_04620 [Myxococcaceae bacterium]
MARSNASFERRFEGSDVLAELLALGGSPYGPEEVAAQFREARKAGLQPADVLPTLFPAEPRFADPSQARRLFQNLLGLWDVCPDTLSLGLAGPRPKKPKPVRPVPLAGGPPTEEWVESAWRFLEQDTRAHTRLLHSFENRQDALVSFLDEEPLSDEGYGVLRHLAFELHAMLELGCGAAPARVDPAALKTSPGGEGGPAALIAYADEALFEAEQDEEAPVAANEAAALRGWVRNLVAALWAARRT